MTSASSAQNCGKVELKSTVVTDMPQPGPPSVSRYETRQAHPAGTDEEEPGWQERALCAQTDPEAFFPEKGGSTRGAKRICSGCEVRAECLAYALAHDERFGIWGGLSAQERHRLSRDSPRSPIEALVTMA